MREGVTLNNVVLLTTRPQLHLILSCVSFKIIYVYVYVLFFHDYDYLVCIFCYEIHSDELCIIWKLSSLCFCPVISVCLSVCPCPSLPLCLSVCLSVWLAFLSLSTYPLSWFQNQRSKNCIKSSHSCNSSSNLQDLSMKQIYYNTRRF